MSKYTRNADGTYSVEGVLTVATEEQAIALTTETGVFSLADWPFVERRKHLRAVTNEVQSGRSIYTTTTFEVAE